MAVLTPFFDVVAGGVGISGKSKERKINLRKLEMQNPSGLNLNSLVAHVKYVMKIYLEITMIQWAMYAFLAITKKGRSKTMKEMNTMVGY